MDSHKLFEPPRQAGWYPDPLEAGTERFHNGIRFTDLQRPTAYMPPPADPHDPLARFSLDGFDM